MELVKKILIFIAFGILNIGLIALGYYFYMRIVRPSTYTTVTPEHFQEIIAVVVLMIGLPLLTLKPFKLFRPVSIGFMALFIPALLFSIFYINDIGSPGSYKRLYPIEKTTHLNNEIILEAYIYEKSNHVKFKVPEDNCLKLDSIQIRIKDGLLGLKIITDDIEFTKKAGCGG